MIELNSRGAKGSRMEEEDPFILKEEPPKQQEEDPFALREDPKQKEPDPFALKVEPPKPDKDDPFTIRSEPSHAAAHDAPRSDVISPDVTLKDVLMPQVQSI